MARTLTYAYLFAVFFLFTFLADATDFQPHDSVTIHNQGAADAVTEDAIGDWKHRKYPDAKLRHVLATWMPCKSDKECEKRCLKVFPKTLLLGGCWKGVSGSRCVCIPRIP